MVATFLIRFILWTAGHAIQISLAMPVCLKHGMKTIMKKLFRGLVFTAFGLFYCVVILTVWLTLLVISLCLSSISMVTTRWRGSRAISKPGSQKLSPVD